MLSAFFSGLSGPVLTAEEARFFKSSRPAGIILFARNVETPEQIRRLVGEAQAAIGADILVLVDQEGGRVQRLRPPHWRALPTGSAYRLSKRGPDAARHVAQLTALDLRAVGINCNCAPVLDVPAPGSHAIIGDRAYGETVADVVRFGRAVMEGTMAGGVVPVIKHIPGHGRAKADSHLELPVVSTPREDLDAVDFAAFKALADAPAAMTAHVVYTAIDVDRPASTSPRAHQDIIRGAIGFDGLLMSDDLSMQALSGTLRARAESVLSAGSDIALHCNGRFEEMQAVAEGSRPLSGRALARFEQALAVTRQSTPLDRPAAEACLAEVFALSA